MSKKFYVTTPIYYVTAKPHLGSLYSTLLADVAARWHQIKGERTFFLTGTDEFGQKIAQAAEKAGKKPQEFVDAFIPAYKKTWKDYHIHYNHFIRTTDHYHVKAVQQWLKDLQDRGDIYKARYEGWYCTPCESYLTEKEAEGDVDPLCPQCERLTQYVSEESYFFKLSKYQDKLLDFYKSNPDFIVPKARLKEVISFVKGGLKDLSISRTTVKWGVPFPDDEHHVAYVWADALNNYITAIGYGQKDKQKEFTMWWPADLQVLGKDIIRFHAVYWPAFLMASDLPLPKKLLVHGWITVNEQKMSKSLGNVVDPDELGKAYGYDEVRYYLMRYMSITQDASFSTQDLEQCITSDLANDFGNLLNRMLTLALKFDLKTVPQWEAWSDSGVALRSDCWNMLTDYKNHMDNNMYHMALARLSTYSNQVNAYFQAQQPWKLDKDPYARDLLTECISAVCHSLYSMALLLWPVMPTKMEKLLQALGKTMPKDKDIVTALDNDRWVESFELHPTKPLFVKPEVKKESVMQKQQEPEKEKKDEFISIDDVAKVELLVGTIEQCEEVPKSEKLLKSHVNFGKKGVKQILSGIKQFFKPEDLIGKQVIVVFNLKPRKMLGMESQGMILVAKDEEGSIQLATVDHPVPNGSRLH